MLTNIYRNFSIEDAIRIKEIEKKTNHDVKSVEYLIKEKLHKTTLSDVEEFIHFGLTSEDINNVSHALSIKFFLKNLYFKDIENLLQLLKTFIKKYKATPMLSRTHGQPASPTTVGKEFALFAYRIKIQLDNLKKIKITAKINGAVGNYNAHESACPSVNWRQFSRDFISSLEMTPVLITTQIKPRDDFAAIFHNIIRINNIIMDMDRDMWGYISRDYLKQKTKEGEVGSSTMPHKVNPINFENSEGNIKIANSLLNAFANELTISRFQRDLSDSTILRNMGTAMAHCIIAYSSTTKGLNKIEVNEIKIMEDLENHPEVVTECIQTVLRKEGHQMPYEKLKELTRGHSITIENIHRFIDGLNITDHLKEDLKRVAPHNYIGIAPKLCDEVMDFLEN